MKRGLTLPKPLGQDSLFDDEDVSPDQQEKAKGSFQKAIATTKTNLKQELIHQINEIDAAEADSLFSCRGLRSMRPCPIVRSEVTTETFDDLRAQEQCAYAQA